MTVKDLMEVVDRLHPNQFTTDDKLRWLNELEQTIWHEVFMTHELPEGVDPEDMPVYDGGDVNPGEGETSPTLLVPDPYSKLYLPYMQSKIAYYNRESGAYDAASSVFAGAYADFRNWYNRQYMPCGMVDHLHLLDRTWGVSG